jgi:hypothetical protein
MKNFKDFYLSGSRENLQKFMCNISDYIVNDWKQSNDSKFKDNFIVFIYCGDKVNKASVFLYVKDFDKLEFKVTNIVPMEKSSLNYDEYNEVLDKWAKDCIIPYVNDWGLSYKVTSENVDLEYYMSKECARKLRMFSSTANKSTGSSHPCDQERWHDFICQTMKDKDKNVISILGRWLVEEEGWDDEHATELVIQYEQGIALLEHYREHYNE